MVFTKGCKPWNKGKKMSKKTKKRLSESCKKTYKEGRVHGMKGKNHTQETKKRISKSKSGVKCKEETKEKMRKAHRRRKHLYKCWKGNDVTYNTLHWWIRNNYGSATKCENPECKRRGKRYEWALIKGKKYKKNINNYIQLCSDCHRKYDRKNT
jgi:hypothetical protein